MPAAAPLALETSADCPQGLAGVDALARLAQELALAAAFHASRRGRCLSVSVGLCVATESLQGWTGGADLAVSLGSGPGRGSAALAETWAEPIGALSRRAAAALGLDGTGGWASLRYVSVRLRLRRTPEAMPLGAEGGDDSQPEPVAIADEAPGPAPTAEATSCMSQECGDDAGPCRPTARRRSRRWCRLEPAAAEAAAEEPAAAPPRPPAGDATEVAPRQEVLELPQLVAATVDSAEDALELVPPVAASAEFVEELPPPLAATAESVEALRSKCGVDGARPSTSSQEGSGSS